MTTDTCGQAALAAYVKLWRATHAVEARVHRHLSCHRLTISQFAVLEALYHLGPLNQRQLSQKILRTSGNMTLVIAHLERDGLIIRTRQTNDRRAMHIELSDQGRALMTQLWPHHQQAIADVFAVLAEPEIETLSEMTRKLGLSAEGRWPPPESGCPEVERKVRGSTTRSTSE